MLKTVISSFAGRLGFQIVGLDHIGVRVEEDLKRLTNTDRLAIIFDVGANVGQTSLMFSRNFPTASIYAFEPVKETYNRLQVAVRHLPNVRTFDCGLGESSGQFQINLCGDSQYNSLKQTATAASRSETVKISTLDTFCSANKIERIDLLKIDVEGFEIQVLKGSRALLDANAIRFVFAECVFAPDTLHPHTSFFDLHKFLTEYGFHMFASYGVGFSLTDGSAVANALFIHRKHMPPTAAGRVRNIV
jgi:FkbM family methyltransferase